MREFHSDQLLCTKPKPISWLVYGLLPLGTLGDVSGPPGDGNTTILLSLAKDVSGGNNWFGNQVSKTRTAWIPGEATSEDAIARDLWRVRAGKDTDILFISPSKEMFNFSLHSGAWQTSDEGEKILNRCREAGIGLLII